jgi:raffinose/stachyose/melibiose transport system substrate-binding protein
MGFDVRRGLLGLLAAGVLAALVGGCGSAGESEGGSSAGSDGKAGTITLWDEFTGGEAQAMKDTIKEFKAQGGATVKERTIGNEDFFTALRTGLAGNSPPDVVQYEGYQQTRDFAKAGRLTDITDFWNTIKDQYELPEIAERGCTHEGRIYCIPVDFVQLQMYYNPELLEENGVSAPKTWDEFIAAGKKLKANGITPVSLGSKDGWPGAQFYMALATRRCSAAKVNDAINRRGVRWTDPCFKQAAQDLQEVARLGFFPDGVQSDDYGAMTAGFLSRKAAFMVTGTWFVGSWIETPPKFDVGMIDFPTIEGAPGNEDVVGGALTDIGVAKKAKNPKDALEFLKFLARKETGVTWGDYSNVSMVKGAIEESKAPKVLRDAWTKTKALGPDGIVNFFEIELPPAVGEDVIYNGATAVAAGKLDPAKFTSQLEDAAQSVQGDVN